MLTRAFVTAFALVVGLSVAGSDAYACGTCKPPMKKVHVNSGVGNGAEFGSTERRDRDPGRSGMHNQAGKNSAKPNSAAALTSIP